MSEDKGIKVTDKRLFTPDGELRDEYRYLEDKSVGGTEPDAAAGQPSQPAAAAAEIASHEVQPEVDLPPRSPGAGAPGFMDLIAVLAEPAGVYMGDVPMPDGRRMENLDMARLHIDLLQVLQEKTALTLSGQEKAVLDDVLYQLRLRFVQKKG